MIFHGNQRLSACKDKSPLLEPILSQMNPLPHSAHISSIFAFITQLVLPGLIFFTLTMLSSKPMVGRSYDTFEGMSKRDGHDVTCKCYSSTSIGLRKTTKNLSQYSSCPRKIPTSAPSVYKPAVLPHLTFKQSRFAYMNTCEKTPLQIQFTYLRNKEIYCILRHTA
jgi:hypothetical protein